MWVSLVANTSTTSGRLLGKPYHNILKKAVGIERGYAAQIHVHHDRIDYSFCSIRFNRATPLRLGARQVFAAVHLVLSAWTC